VHPDLWTIRRRLGYAIAMLPPPNLDRLARRIAQALPDNPGSIRAELEQTVHALLQAGIEKMQLVSREEFEVQRLIQARTREKLESLEARVAELERLLSQSETP
jgi:ubiquinone biosynthesis accessory factor UbiK